MPTPSIEAAVMQLIRDNVAIVALVGDRIHPGHRPQGDSLPCIVVRKSEGGDDPDLLGDEDHRSPSIEVECYADSYFGAETLTELVRGSRSVPGLEQVNQLVTVKTPLNVTVGTLYVDRLTVEDEAIDDTPPTDGSHDWDNSRTLLFSCLCDRP